MAFLYKRLVLFFAVLFLSQYCKAQLIITNQGVGAQTLVQRLVGDGITVSNVTLTGDRNMTGFFKNVSGTNINIDSGIVLTNGRARSIGTAPAQTGMDGNQLNAAIDILADNQWGLPGDADLSALVSDVTNDACVLEFDFVPLGDSIKFNYVFSSEEYTDFACSQYNDAFAFFISGPGITGKKNIALIPGTNLPVTIHNINNDFCGLYPQYYVDNSFNTNFTHDGHTVVLTAKEKVQPCQTYHLKLVIADISDDQYDSGVLLEAKSLSSNVVKISNVTQTDPQNNLYLVEGCVDGSITLKRPQADATPLIITLAYSGSAINGTDIQTLPSSITIPANQLSVTIPLVPIIDNIPEGIEDLKIFAFTGCGSGTPSDSITIQIRDFDKLGILPDSAVICRNAPLPLIATPGYTTYIWDANPTLSSTVINNPVAMPVGPTTYYCTATLGTCNARDSSFVAVKTLSFVSKKDVNCKGATDGEIKVAGGPVWIRPANYSIDTAPYQADSTFSNLTAGIHTVRIKDAAGCIDSMQVTITQLFPDLVITNTAITSATCSGAADGTVTVTVNGGKQPYTYSTDGVNFQPSNILSRNKGNYTVTVMDNNNCTATTNIIVPFTNDVLVDAGADTTICEGTTASLHAVSNGDTYVWSPAATLDNSTAQNPVASPVVQTKYYVTATRGICDNIDSITVSVNPAPVANAGKDTTICFGRDVQLNGSGGTSFVWTPASLLTDQRAANPIVQKPPTSITYSLSVTDANGCTSLKKDDITVTVTRNTVVNAGRDTSVAINQPLQLSATDVNRSGFIGYLWTPAYGLNSDTAQNPLAILDRDIIYTVTAKTIAGCIATDDVKIKTYKGPDIYVPTAFTPNGDGLNDVLKAIPIGMKAFHFFKIFNRWGTLVFNTENPNIGWDGKISGNNQETAAYIWIAEAVDYKGNIIQRKGTVAVVR